MKNERLLPANPDAERTILGAILSDNAALDQCNLQPEDFSLDSHTRIYRAMLKMNGAGEAVDTTTLINRLEDEKNLSAIGGRAYIFSLTENLPRRLSIVDYVRIVKEKAQLRQMLILGDRIALEASDGQRDAQSLIEDARTRLESILGDFRPSDSRKVFVEFTEFCSGPVEKIDWMLDGIIQRGANGFIAAPPKGSKSFCTADMLLALATGTEWLGFQVPRPVRCGLVSREDHYALTGWRLKALMRGRGLRATELSWLDNLFVNTRAQTANFSLQNPSDMRELLAEVKDRKLEFVVLDVLNVLHSADENDNTEMRMVLNQCRRIQDESGASVGIIHHYNKDLGGSITQRLRGASAISGYAEWMIGLTMADEEQRIRKMEFEMKAGPPPEPIYFVIDSDKEAGTAKLRRVQYEAAVPRQSKFKIV